MAMLKIAGKTDGNVAKGIRVRTSGSVSTVRDLEDITPTTILTETELRSTTAFDTTSVECDAYKYPVNAIYITTSLDAAVNAILLDGSHLANAGYLRKLDGTLAQFDIPAKVGNATNVYIVTAEDLPEIDYVRYLKLRLQAKDTPTSGSIKITVVHKG